MKVLFDCILTQTPAKCSTTAQFVTMTEYLLKHENIFIYWPIPDFLTYEEMEAYPRHERIRYIRIPQSKDRMREYNKISPELARILSFDGDFWDWDVLVTVRVQQIPMIRVIANSPRSGDRRAFSRRIIAIENMMILSKKLTVVQSNDDVQDRMTLEAYLAADRVLVPAYHEKEWALDVARVHFSPARVRDLKSKIEEVCHLSLSAFNLKKSEFRYHKNRKMNVAFVGRMERANHRLPLINKIMESQWVMNGDKVNCFVCTVSHEGSVGESEFEKAAVKILHPNRDEFWRIAQEEMDLALFYHVDVELNMSMLEPITFGVPEIIKKAPWSIGMFGPDYPFFVENATQGYAMVSMFLEDYAAQYAKFETWYQKWFVPTYTKRTTDDNMYVKIEESVMHDTSEIAAESLKALKTNEIVRLIVRYQLDELELMDILRDLSKDRLRTLGSKVLSEYERGLIWSSDWNDFRLGLKTFYGYEDASTRLGHLKRIVKVTHE